MKRSEYCVKILAVSAIALLAGCTKVVEVPVEKLPPGVTEQVWEEPMVDTIDVPAGLDPEGHYYRPAHKAVVEVRQGRWQEKK